VCDIIVATPNVTKEKTMIFAKNSDRDPNESQILEYYPRLKHEETSIKLTYVEFPQVKETFSILISRPWWIWGAEMGINEFNLTIGNAAVFTKIKLEKEGLIGMDILRLALERTKSAKEALNFIVNTIETYGQGGNCSYEHKMYYSNSYIIADPKEAWTLETAGKYWVAKRIDGFYSISNSLSIENDWDLASDDVIRLSKGIGNFSFAKYFSDKFYTYFAHGKERRKCTTGSIEKEKGNITLKYIMDLLRYHNSPLFAPWKGSMKDVCMHYGGLTRPSQTASSQVSELIGYDLSINWFTGTSNPCLSLFKPFLVTDETRNILSNYLGDLPTNKYNPQNYWWIAEYLHRKIQLDYRSDLFKKYIQEVRQLEERIVYEVKENLNKKSYLVELSNKALEEEQRILNKWISYSFPKFAPFQYSFKIWLINKKASIYN